MKLSTKTMQILKNFANINQSLLFKIGNKLRVLSDSKDIMVDVKIDENIPVEFGIYDMNKFLSVLSLHKDSPDIDFESSSVLIKSDNDRRIIKYRFCDKSMILVPPEKDINMDDAEIEFNVSEQDLEWILKTASVLGCPNISFSAHDGILSLNALDVKDNSVSNNSLKIAEDCENTFNVIFKAEKIQKLFAGDYVVSISSKGISKFQHKDIALKYFIAVEDGSEYEE